VVVFGMQDTQDGAEKDIRKRQLESGSSDKCRFILS
jgi:hypothetical protein